jgi:hypothetical protein
VNVPAEVAKAAAEKETDAAADAVRFNFSAKNKIYFF